VDSIYSIAPLSFAGISTYPLESRKSKVNAGMFGKPMDGNENIPGFLAKLPHILAADKLRALVRALLYARTLGKPAIWGLGGHVIKVGLGPTLIDLMQHGFITGFAMNGSSAIHDFEIALKGSTSEEVEAQIDSGRFGMARETGEWMNAAIRQASEDGIGMGEGLGRFIANGGKAGEVKFAHSEASILAEAYRNKIPVTVHVAIGTDIIHIHPEADGKSTGDTSHRDFRLLCSLTRGLHEGGVYLNVGSAVILPEVFLKAVSVVRNLGIPLAEFTTANLDFIQHYRPTENVLKRPTQNSGQAIALTGHHEIMVPLIAAALKAAIAEGAPTPEK
jgi:hypothetical protein